MEYSEWHESGFRPAIVFSMETHRGLARSFVSSDTIHHRLRTITIVSLLNTGAFWNYNMQPSLMKFVDRFGNMSWEFEILCDVVSRICLSLHSTPCSYESDVNKIIFLWKFVKNSLCQYRFIYITYSWSET